MKCLMIYITNPIIANHNTGLHFIRKGDHYCNVQGLYSHGFENVGVLVISNSDNAHISKFYPNDPNMKKREFKSIRDAMYNLPKIFGVKELK